MTEVIAALTEELGSQGIVLGEDVRLRSPDWTRPGPCLAKAIVRPKTTEEVSAVLRICHARKQPIVPHGGLTGLVGGAVVSSDEIALSLERMTNIEDVSVSGRTMTVQAGVPLQTVQEQADASGLFFPLDLGARGSCTIGGNVSTNAGGNRVIRYGTTRDLVLGLEVVLADGTILSSMTAMLKNNAGFNLKQLFIGTEGTLGVVTRVVLRLFPKPRSQNVAMAAVSDFQKLIDFLAASHAGFGADLSAFEVMCDSFYRLVTTRPARHAPPLAYGHSFYALVEVLGFNPQADSDRFGAVLGEALERGVIQDAAVARSRAEREALWAMRDDVEQMNRLGHLFAYDVSLAIHDMEGYLKEIKRGLKLWSDPRCVVFGHVGDGNLHILVSVDRSDGDTEQRINEIVYAPMRRLRGSISAEHGIGLAKRAYLSWSRSDAEIELMRTLKRSLDPMGILNPGKVLA